MSKENRVVFIGYPQVIDSQDIQSAKFFEWLASNGSGVFMDDLKPYLESYGFDVELHTITTKQLRSHQLVHSYHFQQAHYRK